MKKSIIRSMTGFGRGEYKYQEGKCSVEIKTVNHRFYEFSARMPNSISFLEDKIRNYVNTQIKRGKINLNLVIEGDRGLEKSFVLNKKLAKRYYTVLNDFKKELAIKEEISLSQIMSLPEVMVYSCAPVDTDRIWPHIKAALDKALTRLVSAREREGAALAKDLKNRLEKIEYLIKNIKQRAPFVVEEYKNTLTQKIKQIAGSVQLDPNRLETEVAIFAKNCDIAEEITRVFAHIESFNDIIVEAQEAGRQLDFIAQEIFREFNTINAKAQDIKISRWTIQAKEQIEKIREQVQNVE